MSNFMIHFLLSNVFISGIIGILLITKWIFRNSLSSRMQYNLWFLLLGLLAIPFIPFRLIGSPQIFSWLESLSISSSNTKTTNGQITGTVLNKNASWIEDFTLSVNSKTPSIVEYILLGLWFVGILVMILLVIRSYLGIRTLKKSSLPLQSPKVNSLYRNCLNEMRITKHIPIYSTAFLKSPIIVGLLKPRIYLPIHLIADYNESDMRFMLLHELNHYKHKDALISYLMNLAGVLYWFNPFVWYALKEMKNDKELACDTSVLKMLEEDAYVDYGNTLINFAEKVSLTPFPFVAGLGGTMKQMKRRIINIASYKKPTFEKKLKGMITFLLIAVLLLGFTPFISTYAADENHYHWKASSKNISYVDLSNYFGKYEGSFVLYDSSKDLFRIHDVEHATLRVAPNSTYKIYVALFGLEEGVITPEDSFIAWNSETYPYEAWNADQTLQSAMSSSVNWYFQEIDQKIGVTSVNNYVHEIGYGNENISGDPTTYWMESSLKVSPIEQVELLIKLQRNSFGFAPENINAVKESIHLFSSGTESLYGKTGTGRVNGNDINGWFVGYIETADNTYFFATNIKDGKGATGSKATEITMSILSDLNIWK